jgi:hypothetical protein
MKNLRGNTLIFRYNILNKKMEKDSKQMQQHMRAMETETIQKNGASPKSLTSRENTYKEGRSVYACAY